jgi:hypothetical protein
VYKEKHNELVSSLCAAAVTDWKVPEEFGEFNLENVEKLLYEYPQIANQVDLLSSNDSRFLAKK